MPSVLLTLEAKDQASSVIGRVRQSLDSLGSVLDAQAAAADRFAEALRRIGGAAADAAGGLKDLSSALSGMVTGGEQLARSADSTVQALSRQGDAAIATARAYRELHTAAADLRAVQLASPSGTPPSSTVPTPATRGQAVERTTEGAGGLLGGMGGLLDMAKYYAGYQLVSMASSAVLTSLSNNQQNSILGGQIVASTGDPTTATQQTVSTLVDSAMRQQMSGTQPYTANTLLQGQYNFLSQGFSSSDAKGLNALAVGLSQIGGMPDTQTAGNALLATGNAFGWGKDVVASGQMYANYLQTGTNIGAYSLADMARALPNAGLAGLGRSGIDTAAAMTLMTQGSFAGITAEMTAQQMNALGSSFSGATIGAQRAAKSIGMDLTPGAVGRAGGAIPYLDELRDHLSGLDDPHRQAFLKKLFPNQDARALVSESWATTGPRSLDSVFSQMSGGQSGAGAYGTALNIVQKTPGEQLADSENKLKGQFDNLTKSLMPLESRLITSLGDLADAASSLADAFTTGKGGDYVGGALRTLGNVLNPASPDFLNKGKAASDSGGSIGGTAASIATAVAALGSGPLGVMALGGALLDRATGSHVAHVLGSTENLVGGVLGRGGSALTGILGGIGSAFTTPGSTDYAATLGRGGGTPGMLHEVATRAAQQVASTGGLLGGIGSTSTAAQRAQWAASALQVIGTSGKSTTTADVSRFEGNFQIAMEQGKGRNTLESAYGLAVNAIKNDPEFTGQQKTLEIDKLTSALTAALGTNPNVPQRAAFSNTNPLMAGFAAGEGGTVARFGTGQDTQAQIIAHLQQQLTAANRQINLLERLVANTTQRPHAAAHPNLLAGTGVNRMIPR